MEAKPIKCQKLRNLHEFINLKPLLLDAKNALKALDQTKKKVYPAIFDLLNLQEAFDAMQKNTSSKKLSALLGQSKKDSKFENYLKAIRYLNHKKNLNPIDEDLLINVHKIIQKTPKPNHKKYRLKQNWIGPEGCNEKEAYFFPPQSEDVPDLMKDLYKYLKSSKDDPLIKLSIWFARLLIIHPFMDGNGRLARLFIGVFLKHFNLSKDLNFCPSFYFKKNRLKYFETLYEITESNKLEKWIRFFIKGIIFSAKREIKHIKMLQKNFENASRYISKQELSGIYKTGVFQIKDLESENFKKLLKDQILKINSKKKAWAELSILPKLSQ